MPRKLISGAEYPEKYRGEVIRLAEIATNVAIHYFGAKQTIYLGHLYLPLLVMAESGESGEPQFVGAPIHRIRSQQVDGASITLQNADGQMEAWLLAEKWEGAAVRLLDFFPPLYDACHLIRGALSNRQADDIYVSFDIVPDWDAGNIETPPRNYSRTCTWRFKKPPCGYVGDVTSCDKDYASCTAHGRTHRFNGFVQVNASLVSRYPPTRDGGGGGDARRRGGGGGRGGEYGNVE